MYRDAHHFDALQDARAEASIGTGDPLTLAEAHHQYLTSGSALTTPPAARKTPARAADHLSRPGGRPNLEAQE